MAADNGKPSIIGPASSIIPLILLGALLYLLPQIAAGQVIRFQVDWIPSLGIALTLVIDGLSLLFGLIISCAGFYVSLYAADYLPAEAEKGKFYFLLHRFLLAMLGLVMADNFLAIFVFWELTTLISFLLIGFEHDLEKARQDARQALLVTGTGALALLVGFLLLGHIANTYDVSQMPLQSAAIKADPLYLTVLLLVFLGAFTKSAQFPFHFWLPASIYLISDRNLIRFIFGLILTGNAINLLIFTVGRLESQRPPLIPEQPSALQEQFANALPQALILTAIVIGFALLSFIFILFYRTYQALGTADTESVQVAEADTNAHPLKSKPNNERSA